MNDDDYYSAIGEFLKKNLASEENVFEVQRRERTRYRKLGNVVERRPPPRKVYEEDRNETEEQEDFDFQEVLIPVPDDLVEDFAVLQLRPGSSLSLCKNSWRRLLKKFHPDTITTKKSITVEEAAQVVRRINTSYKRILHWYETGLVLPVDKTLG